MNNEVISAWDVYWVMQLDSIGTAFVLATISVTAVAITFLVCAWMAKDFREIYRDSTYEEGRRRFAEYDAGINAKHRAARRLAPIALPLLLVTPFIPSTKTAAAMLILPAIANNETIQKEAGELYGLAKEALREAVGGDEKDTKAE